MTRQETLDILDEINRQLSSMSEDDLYNCMMKTSPSFRRTVRAIEEYFSMLDNNPTEGSFSHSIVETETPVLPSIDSPTCSSFKKDCYVNAKNVGVGVKTWNLVA